MTARERAALEPAAGAEPTGRWITTQRDRPMSLAVMLPLLRPSQPGAADNGEDFWALVEKAKLAIEVGFDMIWFPDHFTLAHPDLSKPEGGIWECWTTLAGLAAALPGVPMGPMVACTGFHNPGSIATCPVPNPFRALPLLKIVRKICVNCQRLPFISTVFCVS